MLHTIHFNTIYVLQSLQNDELPTGKNLYTELLQFGKSTKSELDAVFVNIESKLQFTSVLERILSQSVTYGVLPFLHFEMHGNKHGLVLGNGQLLTWEELYSLLAPINIKTKNNLFVSVAACFGGYIFNSINITQRAPFYCFVGPTKKMAPEDLLTDFKNFFYTLMRTLDINAALDDLNNTSAPKNYIVNTSELIFEQVYTHWLEMYNSADYVENKVKQLSLMARSDSENSGISDKQIEEFIRNEIKLQPEFARKCMNYFCFKSDDLTTV